MTFSQQLKCIAECDNGTFGFDCTSNCSTNCLNELPCNKRNGHCDNGCNPGYTGSDCKTRELIDKLIHHIKHFCISFSHLNSILTASNKTA